LTFALDAKTPLPATPPRRPAVPLDAPEFVIDSAKAAQGEKLYGNCTLCHGSAVVGGGVAPDLRASPVPLSAEAFNHIVRDGSLVPRGMPKFDELSDAQLDALRHYFRQRARDDIKLQAAAGQGGGTAP
jgi:quinohemoprotein ethanol dehydrogenase